MDFSSAIKSMENVQTYVSEHLKIIIRPQKDLKCIHLISS